MQDTKLKGSVPDIIYLILENLGNEIAHELRTPLSAIRTSVSGIKDYLPSLIQTYQESVQAKLVQPTILQRDLDLLRQTLEIIESASNRASDYINTLVSNLTLYIHSNRLDKEKFSVIECLSEVLTKYNYNSSQRKLIYINAESKDFHCAAVKSSIVNVFTNIIKYIIQQIEVSGKGRIEVFSAIFSDANHIYFRESENVISADHAMKLFNNDDFERTNLKYIGPFLCREYMKSIGGNVSCQFYKNMQIEIVLTFPIIK